MYLLRLALTLGQCDQQRWQSIQQQLVESRFQRTVLDVQGLHDAQEHVHALLPSIGAGPTPPVIDPGVLSRSLRKKGELIEFIERGYTRLARINLLFDVTNKISLSERRNALRALTLMLMDEDALRPELAVTLVSAMGHDVIGRASSVLGLTAGPEGIPRRLALDIGNLQQIPDGSSNIVGQQAVVAIAKLAAMLGIKGAVGKWGTDLPSGVAERSAKLQSQLLFEIRRYRSDDRTTAGVLATGVLGAAHGFIAHELLNQSELNTGTIELDVFMELLDVVVSGCVLLSKSQLKPPFSGCDEIATSNAAQSFASPAQRF